jgi:hypothetical protein
VQYRDTSYTNRTHKVLLKKSLYASSLRSIGFFYVKNQILIGGVKTLGTNYYLNFEPCKHCGMAKPEYHIGKSSGGWTFGLHVDPNQNINSLEDIYELCKIGTIKNEYDEIITIEKLKDVIENRSWEPDRVYADQLYPDEKEFLRLNHAVKGPNNLMRSQIDGIHCIGHGSGTWDLIIGEFS